MKKVFYLLALSVLIFSVQSCRETTQDKTEEAIEAIGEDVEAGTKNAAEKVEQEIDEEIHETDDHRNHDH